MRFNEAGLALIKRFEGLRLVVYRDAVGLPTVGFGRMDKRLKIGDKITEEEAEVWLKADIAGMEAKVRPHIKIALTDNEYSAIISLAFNVGAGNVISSTLLNKVNTGDLAGAADEFLKWNKAGGKVLNGLTTRRQAERELFLQT